MVSAQDILKFHFSVPTLQQSAAKIIPRQLGELNNFHIEKLNRLSKELGERLFQEPTDNSIPKVFRKFKEHLNDRSIKFDRRELRTLSYALPYSETTFHSILGNIVELKYALEVLNSTWRDTYLSGLIDCLLKQWESPNREEMAVLESFISERISKYTGKRAFFISYKDNLHFFNIKNGAEVYGDTLARLKKPIGEMTKHLNASDKVISYSYFSKAIFSYYNRSKSEILNLYDDIYDVLTLHNNSVTDKRVLCELIIQANKPEFASIQEHVKAAAFNRIGDPEKAHKWAPFENATEQERKALAISRTILNEWIAKQFIDVFFNVCINDIRRKNFWLNIASKHTLTFRVIGPKHTQHLLEMDNRISAYVAGRFTQVRLNKDVSAIIIFINEYTLIEFSNEGYAFYAYKNDSPNKPDMTAKLGSVDELRNSSMPMAIQSDSNYEYYNDEGRLTHRDGYQVWETRFMDWMNKIVFR